jgi:hypothetical protein
VWLVPGPAARGALVRSSLPVAPAAGTAGTWGPAKEVPGTGTLNAGGGAQVVSLSCAPAGGCAAGGFYTDASGHHEAFVGDELNGVWGQALEVPSIAALNADGVAQVTSLSCASAGNCTAGGL